MDQAATIAGSMPQKAFDSKTIELEPWPAWPEEDTLEGEVKHSGTVLVRDQGGAMSVGVWECPPCKFRDFQTSTSTAQIVKGRGFLIHESTGERIELKPGVQFAASPDGSAVIWEIHETIRKFYVLHEPGHEDRYY
jgi:uncharacterized cupin superfamily protein